MSSALVQQAVGTSAGTTSMTLTLSPAPGNGSIVIGLIGGSLNATPCDTPTETNVSGFNRTVLQTSATRHSEIWGADVGGSAGPVCTVTAPVAHSFRGNLSEWTGLTQVGATGSGLTTGATTTPTSPSITPIAGRACVIVAQCVAPAGNVQTPTNGFLPLTTGNTIHAQAYLQVASASGSYSVGWTSSLTQAHDVTIAVFYEPVGGGSVAFNPLGGNPLTGFIK